MKAGYKTTEFWITTITAIVGLLVTMGVFSDGEGETVLQAVGILVTAIASASYTYGRSVVKSR